MVTTNSLTTLKIESDQEFIEKQPHSVLSMLKTLLADECLLYISMLGVNHAPLSAIVEDHLNEIDVAMGKIAEYTRRYNTTILRTMDDFLQKAHLNDAASLLPDTQIIIAHLITSHSAIIRFLRENILVIDAESGDVDAIDLMLILLQQHQEMMKSLQMYLRRFSDDFVNDHPSSI